jgi:uncharacterized membrane protein
MKLTLQRLFNVSLLIAGIVLFMIGLHASHAIADQAGSTFFGRFSHSTTWFILGGIAAGALALYLLLTDLLSTRTHAAKPRATSHARHRRSGTH